MALIAGGIVGGVVATGGAVFFESPTNQDWLVQGIVVCNETGALAVFNIAVTSGGAPVPGDYLYFAMELDPAPDAWREWAQSDVGLFTLAPGSRVYVECTGGQVAAQVFGEKRQK